MGRHTDYRQPSSSNAALNGPSLSVINLDINIIVEIVKLYNCGFQNPYDTSF